MVVPRKRKKSDLPLATRMPKAWAALQLVREHRARVDAFIADADTSDMADLPVMIEVGPSRKYRRKPAAVDLDETDSEPAPLSE